MKLLTYKTNYTCANAPMKLSFAYIQEISRVTAIVAKLERNHQSKAYCTSMSTRQQTLAKHARYCRQLELEWLKKQKPELLTKFLTCRASFGSS